MFYPLFEVQALHDGLCHPCQAADKQLLVIHRQGQTFITDRFCPHQQFLLDQAVISDQLVLTCPRHQFHYQLGSGDCFEAHFCLPHYQVVLQDGQVGVEL